MTHRPSGVRRAAVATTLSISLAAMMMVGTLLGTGSVAGAASNGHFSIFPTTVSGQLPRTYFQPVLAAGQTYQDSATVINQTADTATFNIYATDATDTRTGGFALARRTAPKVGMGAWVQLPVSQVTLTGKSYEQIPFSIIVPPNATPGDHAGGIVIEETKGTTTKHGSVAITVLQAVGVRIYGRVQGKLTPALTVTKLSVNPHATFGSEFGGPTASTVTFTVSNTGNVRLASKATVSVDPLFGSSAGTRTVNIPELLPDNSATFTVPFKSVIPFGFLTATVHVTGSGSTTAATDRRGGHPLAPDPDRRSGGGLPGVAPSKAKGGHRLGGGTDEGPSRRRSRPWIGLVTVPAGLGARF